MAILDTSQPLGFVAVQLSCLVTQVPCPFGCRWKCLSTHGGSFLSEASNAACSVPHRTSLDHLEGGKLCLPFVLHWDGKVMFKRRSVHQTESVLCTVELQKASQKTWKLSSRLELVKLWIRCLADIIRYLCCESWMQQKTNRQVMVQPASIMRAPRPMLELSQASGYPESIPSVDSRRSHWNLQHVIIPCLFQLL